MKTKAGIEKPLAEWTAQEVVDFCQSRSRENCGKVNCGGCCIWDTNICKMIPSSWNLTEKPKFTEQEVQDAKNIMRMLEFESADAKISRIDGAIIVNIKRQNFSDGISISKNMFPSIKKGDTYTFSEIIGDANA